MSKDETWSLLQVLLEGFRKYGRPPSFELSNSKIIKRHIFATALSFFWKDNSDYFGSVEDFFFHEGVTGPDLFMNYLSSKPGDLKDYIVDAVPSAMHEVLKLNTWGWVGDLYNQDNGVMLIANKQLTSDISQLEKVKDNYVFLQKFRRADVIKRNISTIKKRYLINFLSQNNIIPKYGFPVELIILHLIIELQNKSEILQTSNLSLPVLLTIILGNIKVYIMDLNLM